MDLAALGPPPDGLGASSGALLRSWSAQSARAGKGAGETLLVAFGGLEKRLGGGPGGFAPYEFVKTCEAVGARWTLFVRDNQQAWYLRGLEGHASASSFDGVLEAIRAEISAVRPKRIVTIGASMGGYAAVRAAVALGADAAIAFSPQVLLDPHEREAAGLPVMTFDHKLCALKERALEEGFKLEALTSIAKCAPDTASTVIELHVGAEEEGDVMEAHILRDAVRARSDTCGLTCTLQLHAGCDHSVVGALRDSGQLQPLLRRHLRGPGAPPESAAVALGLGGAQTTPAWMCF